MYDKLSIIIPVYNEANTIEELLIRVWNQQIPLFKKELIIVESNSSDGSREKVKETLKNLPKVRGNSVQLILQKAPNGKGNAVREGLKAASGDIILIQDGDLEYDTRDYPTLLEPILSGKAAFVLGSRHLGAGNWKIRKFEENPIKSTLLNFGGIFFHGFFNLLYQQRLTDPTTMYKVFLKKCLKDIHLEANRFDFDYELLGKLLRKGFIPYEVAISYCSRSFSEGKKIRVFRDPITWIQAIIKYRFAPLDRPIVRQRTGIWVSYIFVFLLSFFLGSALMEWIGGPLTSPDSLYYLKVSESPYHHMNEWHPAGLSFLLYFFSIFGIGTATSLQITSSLFALALYGIFRQTLSPFIAWIGLILCWFDPALLMLQMTLWTEIPFIVTLLCTAWILSKKNLSKNKRFAVGILFFLISIQFRHAGLFLFPALMGGLSLTWKNNQWRTSWSQIRKSCTTAFFVWLVSNLIFTKSVFHATKHPGEECKSLVVSLNALPYCTWDPSIPICAIDLQRSYLNSPQFKLSFNQIPYHDPAILFDQRKNSQIHQLQAPDDLTSLNSPKAITSCEQLHFLQYSGESPIVKFLVSGGGDICKLRNEIASTVILHAPLEFTQLILKRAWQQFGPWEWTERSQPQTINQDRIQTADYVLYYWNRIQFVYYAFLIVSLAAISFSSQYRTPEIMYLIIGAIGHALGIALVNPFLSLRYMAVSKILITVAFLKILLIQFQIFTNKHRNS